MDVVPSKTNPKELFVYLVNHRVPLGGVVPAEVGADSVIEIFTTTVGRSRALKHKKTIEDPIIVAPNSVSGSDDGESFYFTNDRGVRVGPAVSNDFLLFTSSKGAYANVRSGIWSSWDTVTLL